MKIAKMKRYVMFNVLKQTFKIYIPLSRRSMSKKSTSNENSLNYCADIVRQHDYENFLATLLMTKAFRTPTFVVRAFNVEIARIQDQTTDPQTAAFRLQFWQDTINNIFVKNQILQNIPANPIAQELFKVCSVYNLPRRYLERLITSRSSLLKSRYFRNLEEIERYSEETVSSIYYLLLCVAGVTNVHADHAASHLGKAQGITNMLRSIHVSSQHKMITLPMDILMKNGISQETVLRGTDSDNMRSVIFEVSTRANSHLQKARSISVPQITNQLFLPAIAIDAYLKKLQKQNFNVFHKSLQRGNATLPLILYFNRLINKF